MSLRPCLGAYIYVGIWFISQGSIHKILVHSRFGLRWEDTLICWWKSASRFFPYDTPSFLFKFIIQKYTRIYGAGLRYTAARVCVLKISSAVCDVVCFYFSAQTTKLAVTPHPFNITLNFSSLALIYSWLIPKYQPLCSNLLQYNLTTCSVNKKWHEWFFYPLYKYERHLLLFIGCLFFVDMALRI